MAKRRVAVKGRSVLALLLLGFVLVASLVIWRRSYGIAQGRSLRELDRELRQLQARKAELERTVRDASTRAQLAPVAERRLGLRTPHDSEVVFLPRTADTAARGAPR
ncbi:MAG TPA: hypothetical protein VFY16_02610 [Gemmatimonadaceae bacterium]|nr:hypothetical protein [Gemmatimonadaceae bacterium]